MGRPRKGVVQRPDGQWTVSLPLAVGSKQTRQFTDPDSYRTNRPAPALTALALGDRTPARAGAE